MKSFKKRTIALVLASVVSVAGSFAAERYKNSLMALKFENSSGGALNMLVETKSPYEGSLTFSKRDANTYVLMLPEMNSQAVTPSLKDVSDKIASVSVNTLPYTTNGKGYTRVVVKTHSSVYIAAQPKLFIASEEGNDSHHDEMMRMEQERMGQELRRQEARQRALEEAQKMTEDARQARQRKSDEAVSQRTTERSVKVEPKNEEVSQENEVSTPAVEEEPYMPTDSSSQEPLMLIMAVLLIIGVSAYLYVKAKDRMTDLAGETLQIDVTTDETPADKPKASQKIKTIKSTVKTLDAKYPKPSSMQSTPEYVTPAQPIKTVSEESNIVDLDELFNEKKTESSIEDEENAALEDFLSGFSFDEEYANSEVAAAEAEENAFDEELFNSVMENKKLRFTNDDIKKLDKLLSMEVQDDTMKNISNYLVSNPIVEKPSMEKILEGFITTYSVSNDITFTKDDISALQKIITVEFDNDFVTDLRVNPERTKQMQKEMEAYNKDVRKPAKIKTLNVKKELPDLSKLANKNTKITSDYKVNAVDYGENCEVSTLQVDLDVDFSNASTTPKEKEKVTLVEDNWETGTLKIADMLPDLNDALANPDKYKKPEPEKFVADENTLLQGLSNITFKPFDDGSREFEVINNVYDMDELVEDEGTVLSLSEVQEELQKLHELEHLGVPEESTVEITKPSMDTVETVQEKPAPVQQEIPREVQQPQVSKSVPQVPQTRQVSVEKKPQTMPVKTQTTNQNAASTKCVWENKAFNVVSTVNFSDTTGCHLAKNETGYIILGFIGDRLFKVKEYQELKSEKIQARLNEKLNDGHLRYLVRVGLNKIIVDVSGNEVKYVIDLC